MILTYFEVFYCILVCCSRFLLFVQMSGTFLRGEGIKSPDPRPDRGESERSKNAIFKGWPDGDRVGHLF